MTALLRFCSTLLPCPSASSLRHALPGFVQATRPASRIWRAAARKAHHRLTSAARHPAVPPLVGAAALRATASMSAAPALNPDAQRVLDYWLGPGWESAPPDEVRADRMSIWFSGSPEVDAAITKDFGPLCEALIAGDLDGWRAQPVETVAGIIVGDQLSRNVYRSTAKMYVADPRVLEWSRGLIADGTDRTLKPLLRTWIYMPLMHSEILADQDECVRKYEQLKQEAEEKGWANAAKLAGQNAPYAAAHRDTVAKWGELQPALLPWCACRTIGPCPDESCRGVLPVGGIAGFLGTAGRFPHRNAILGRENTPAEAESIAAGTMPKW